jgi:hypothetical protein
MFTDPLLKLHFGVVQLCVGTAKQRVHLILQEIQEKY